MNVFGCYVVFYKAVGIAGSQGLSDLGFVAADDEDAGGGRDGVLDVFEESCNGAAATGGCCAFVEAIDDQVAAGPGQQGIAEQLDDGRTGGDLVLGCHPSLPDQVVHVRLRCELGSIVM
jgi:hypothetical protein